MPLNIDPQQILLHWMNLAILIGGLYLLLYKPVKQFMEKREAHYKDLDAQAAEKLAQAEQLKAQCQAKLDGADEEIRQAAQEQLDQAEAQAQHILAKARTEAEQSRERALRESQREMRELAAKAAKKLAAQPGADLFDRFLDLTEGGGQHEGR